ncbi:MAG: acyltransferase, partial [Dokdonella sp.]
MKISVVDPSTEVPRHGSGSFKRFESIQVLRAIAAVAVVLYHVREYMKVVGGVDDSIFRFFTEIFSSGATLFFCISGFLMAHLVASQYRNFLPRRLLRIYPTFFIAVALAVGLEAWAYGPQPRPDLLPALSLLPWGPIGYPLRIEWTLVFEVFFYLVCAVFTLGRLRRLFPVFLVIWLVTIVVAVVAGLVPQSNLPTYRTIFFQWYNVYFIAGALTYHVVRRLPALPAVYCYALLAVIIPLIVFWPLLKTIPAFWANEQFILVGLMVAILVVALSLPMRVPAWVSNLAIKLGDYSYGIYLIHVPVMVAIIATYTYRFGPPNSLVALAALLACMVVGWYLGKLDVRIHQWIGKRIFRVRQPTAIEGALEQ